MARRRRRAKADVTVSKKADGKVEKQTKEVDLEWSQYDGEPAKVEVRAGVTREIGEFEFLRVDVGITRPCNPSDNSIEECYQHTATQVANMLTEEQDAYFRSTNN